MKQLFLLLSGCLFMSSTCAQHSTPVQPKKQGMYVNINIDIAYKDKDGNDLLDAAGENHFEAKDIVLYNIQDGEKVRVSKPHMDHPNNQFVYKDEVSKTNLLRVFLEKEVVLIQLNNTTTDTIECTIKKGKNHVDIGKVWYNGVLKWTSGKDTSQVITIVK